MPENRTEKQNRPAGAPPAAAPGTNAGTGKKTGSPKKGNRFRKRKRLLLAAAVLAAVFLFWYGNIEWIRVNPYAVSTDKTEGDIRIALISDLHGKNFGIRNRRLLDAVRRTKPDLVAVTGDLYTKGDRDGEETAYSLLAALAAEFPVYYVSGEHEHGATAFFERLQKAGVHVLHERSETAEINGNRIVLCGITNCYYPADFDLTEKFTVDPSAYNILLAHIPNRRGFEQAGFDLVLCGDTHGGQVRLPFLGAVTDGATLFPELSGIPIKGLYPFEDGGAMVVTGGLGNYPVPVRLLNPPEVAVITVSGR